MMHRAPPARRNADIPSARPRPRPIGVPIGRKLANRMSALLLAFFLAITARAADSNAGFAAANQLYEQGKFAEAATGYRQVIDGGARTADAWYNLGNALFKAGQPGRAVAAYRQAGQLTPRDPALRANLDFVRRQAAGGYAPLISWWIVPLRYFTLNEWAVAAVAALASLFLTLAAGEWRGTRPPRSALAVLAVLALVCSAGAGAGYCDVFVQRQAVVISKQATVRFGPLPDSQVALQLNDGAEVAISDASGDWVQVRDAARRSGWVKRDDLLLIHAASVPEP